MYIVNKHGIIHTIEDGAPLPAGARPATGYEAEYYDQPNSDCVAAKAPKPEKKKPNDKPPV
jgi:hypothetical protein